MMNVEAIKSSLEKVQSNIESFNPAASLVCVCKKFPPQIYTILKELGQYTFAENYVQEAETKRETLSKKELEDMCFHFIGQIQSNKLKQICNLFSCVHSLDKLKHAQKMNSILMKKNKTMDVLVHVNLAQENQKSGIEQEILKDFLLALNEYQNLHCVGLMTFPPYQKDVQNNRVYFKKLSELLDTHRKFVTHEDRFKHLSMGVSNDYTIALEEGATMIRLGSVILGSRENKHN